jgi:predicted nuclease of predicted toxin-antitoxin system
MTIYVDENVPQKITTRLRVEGYQVEYVTRRVEDKDILEAAYKQNALLITSDKDTVIGGRTVDINRIGKGGRILLLEGVSSQGSRSLLKKSNLAPGRLLLGG